MGVSIPAVMKRAAEFEVERAIEFAELYAEKYSEEMSSLEAMAGDEDEGMENFADEAWMLGKLLDDAWAVTVVNLYRVVELNTAKILGWRFGSNSEEART